MKYIKLVLSFLFMFVIILDAQTFDTEKSIVNFSIRNMKVNTVKGTFTGMQGEINFDVDNLENSGFNVYIDPATVSTDNKKRDDHLRNEDFFHVEKYPKILYVSSSVNKIENGYHTKGNLTMHGITKEVEGDFNFNGEKFWGNVKVNRLDYKVGEGTNTFMVGDEVSLEIICYVK